MSQKFVSRVSCLKPENSDDTKRLTGTEQSRSPCQAQYRRVIVIWLKGLQESLYVDLRMSEGLEDLEAPRPEFKGSIRWRLFL